MKRSVFFLLVLLAAVTLFQSGCVSKDTGQPVAQQNCTSCHPEMVTRLLEGVVHEPVKPEEKLP